MGVEYKTTKFSGYVNGSASNSAIIYIEKESGETISDNGEITGISYEINMYASGASGNTWRLYYIRVIPESTSSNYKIAWKEGSDDYTTVDTASATSDYYAFKGSFNYTDESRGRFENTNKFRCHLKANISGSPSSRVNKVIVTVNWKVTTPDPSVTAPGAPSISQGNDNTISMSWTGSTGSHGSGDVTYKIQISTNGSSWSDKFSTGTGTSKNNINISNEGISYGTNYFRIVALYSGTSATGSSTGVTIYRPTITISGSISVSGGTKLSVPVVISWNTATQSYSSGSIVYHLKIGTSSPILLTNTSYTINASYNYPVTTAIELYATDSYATSDTLTSQFRFTGTILYYDSNSQTLWKECMVYYYSNGNWIPCVMFIHENNSWL